MTNELTQKAMEMDFCVVFCDLGNYRLQLFFTPRCLYPSYGSAFSIQGGGGN
jgi:hypothetical protein